nr:MAG TPA: hypothetical protein [Caudoviricetes sp.]
MGPRYTYQIGIPADCTNSRELYPPRGGKEDVRG